MATDEAMAVDVGRVVCGVAVDSRHVILRADRWGGRGECGRVIGMRSHGYSDEGCEGQVKWNRAGSLADCRAEVEIVAVICKQPMSQAWDGGCGRVQEVWDARSRCRAKSRGGCSFNCFWSLVERG